MGSWQPHSVADIRNDYGLYNSFTASDGEGYEKRMIYKLHCHETNISIIVLLIDTAWNFGKISK